MTRLILSSVALLGLAACLQGGPSAAPAAKSDGEARKLKSGMSTNDAFGVFGPESGFERNPADWDVACLSYAYGAVDAPRYVHAKFRNDVLESATDGHGGICTYAEPVVPAT